MGKKFHISGGDISDGYHTFDELYEHRNLLFLNLCLAHRDQCVWKMDPHTPQWFILYWESGSGQISYHIQEKYRYLVDGKIRQDDNYNWDGHTSYDVLVRLDNEASNAAAERSK